LFNRLPKNRRNSIRGQLQLIYVRENQLFFEAEVVRGATPYEKTAS